MISQKNNSGGLVIYAAIARKLLSIFSAGLAPYQLRSVSW
jgi:hypothetical protein